MLVSKKIVLFFLSLLALVSVRAERILFAHYTEQDGLASNSVFSVSQDTNGFVWMATRYGISRFDGTNFKNFNSSTDSVVLRNDIYYTFLLPNGKPTFSSSNAVLFSYNELTGTFEDISSFLPENKYKYDVKGFSVQQNGEGILATACGLYRYNNSTNQFDKVRSDYENHVLDVCTDKFSRYWVAHFNGLLFIDQEGKVTDVAELKGELINKLFRIDDNHILVCSSGGGIWLVTIESEQTLPIVKMVNAPFKYVTAVVADKTGCLWMGTLGHGLWKCRFSGGHFSYDKVVPLNEPEDALSKISSLFVDREGNIWVPTQSSGVWRTTSVNGYAYIRSTDVGFPVAVGASFCVAGNGDILLGTDGMGLYLLDSSLQVRRSIPGLSSNSVLTIVNEGDDYLIGYWGGETNRYNLKTGAVSKVRFNGIDKPRYTTKNIYRTADGTVYLSAAGEGVYRGRNDQWEKLLLMDSSMANYPDIWLEGTCQKPDGTVLIYSARTIWSNKGGRFQPLLPDADKSRSSNPLHVNHCVATADNRLYAATNKGIYYFDADDRCLGVMDYVPMGEYASLLIDNDGILWASGSNGILAVNTQKRTVENVMSAADIHSADYFTGRACLLAESGKIFFGSKEGFICVQPDVKANMQVDYMAFSQLAIHGERVPVGKGVLPKPLKELGRLELGYSQNNFSLGFDLVDFALVNHFIPKYRIPQIDSAWIDLGDKRTIDVAYLPAGDFTVELAAFSGNIPAKVVVLPVTISSPWWQTGWFYLLVVLLLCSLFYVFYRARMRRMMEYRRELQLMVDERTRDLNGANILLAEQKSAIEATNQSLLESLKQKDQMVSVVAHDLKNPMFAIVSTLRRLLSGVHTQAEQQRMLTKLVDESEGLQKEMVDLLQWASGEAELSAFHPTAVNANMLVEEALSLLKGLAGEKGILLNQAGMAEYSTWADSRMFSAIVRNLVTNAIKFSPTGSKITVAVEETDAKTIVRVEDKGVGMPPEKVEDLLKGANVTSTSGTEQEAGFGFGFKIVMDYVRKNGGNLQINSKVGEGTVVTVALPMYADQRVEPLPKEQKTVEVNIDKALLSGKSILVVDDDELILEHVSALLSPYVEVLQAHDGEEGLSVAQAHVPDLIISDVDMPNMNGIEMSEKLMGHLLTSNIPLLFLSAKTDNNVRLKGLSLGAVDYIAKPFSDDELLVKICNFLLWQQKLQLKALTKTYEGGDAAEVVETVNPLLEKIINLVKENYSNPMYSLADIVRELGMSKATLSRRLKSITDKTPMEIMTEYRLSMAKSLLEDGQMSVSDVAYAVGFNDPSYFSRRFKEVFGTNPKSMR